MQVLTEYDSAIRNGANPRLQTLECFLVSRISGNIGLIAVALCPIGADIEVIADSKLEGAGIVAIVCHETEQAELDIVSEVERWRLFYQL